MALASVLQPSYTEPLPEPTPSGFKTNPALDAMLATKEPPPVTQPLVSEEAKAREAELYAAGKRAADTIGQSRKELDALGGPPKLDPVPDAPIAKHTNPIEAFGSTASILAMIGSLATKRPLMNALNNAAGVLEAYKANDVQRANEEFARWKANTDNAFKLHDYQSQTYRQALDLIQSKGKLAADEVQVLASSYGDPVMKELAKAQRYAEMEDYAMKRESMFNQLRESYAEIGAMQQREELVQAFINSEEAAGLTPDRLAAKINEIRNPSKSSAQGFAVKDAGSLLLPDGTKTTGYLDPNTKQLMVHDPATGEYVPAPPGTQRVSVNAGGPLTAQQWQKLNLDINLEENGLRQLNKYMTLMKDVPSGINRWVTDWSGRAKTFFNNPLNAEEFKLKTAEAKIQALLGLFRESVVGPGVMTEYDAVRVLKALGDDPTSALQNPDVLREIIMDMYQTKSRRLEVFKKDRARNAPFFERNAVEPTANTSPASPAAPAAPAQFTQPDAGTGPAVPGVRPLPPELAPGTPDRKAYDALKGATIEWIDDVTGQVGYYRIEGDKMVPVEKPAGPAGGPLESSPPSRSTAPASPATPRTPAVKPEPAALYSPQNSTPGMVNAQQNAPLPRALGQNPRRDFNAPLPEMAVQSAEPQSAVRAAITSNFPRDPSETLAASRRDIQADSRPVYDIETRRREAANRFDKLLGRSKSERGKPKRYKLTRDADGSTIVEVLP